jgi:hypothetical protein
MKKTAVLKYNGFVILPCDCAKERFDLYREGISKKGKPTMKAIGYGYRFSDALETMIGNSLAEEDIIELSGYIDAYKKQIEELKSIVR